MAKYVIGIDGGGTKTRGAIATVNGPVLAEVVVGSTNYNAYPFETVRANMAELVDSLVRKISTSVDQVVAVVMGLSGCDRPEDKPVFLKLSAELLPCAKCLPVNDAIVALFGGAGSAHGIQVISGTGSIAYGFDGPDNKMRCGGWGNILGDEGSGWALGLAALRATIQAYDGIAPQTLISDKILENLNLATPPGLLGWLREVNNGNSSVASLSRMVFDAAAEGDEIALNIMRRESLELAKQAAHVGHVMFAGRSDYKVVVGGGNLRGNRMYFDMFNNTLAELLPGIEVVLPAKEPVEGAVLYAQSIAQ